MMTEATAMALNPSISGLYGGFFKSVMGKFTAWLILGLAFGK
jgi:hypothetical protein